MRSRGYVQPGIFTIWCYIPPKSLKLCLLIGHRFYMNLCHTVFSQAIFWKLLSRALFRVPTEITDECCTTTTTRRSSRVRDLDRFEASSLILLQPHFSALTAIISVFLTLLCLSYSAMENALLWMMWLLRRPNWRQTSNAPYMIIFTFEDWYNIL